MTGIDWSKLTFSYTKTNTMLCSRCMSGQWTPVESRTDDNISISAFAGGLHYAIECFEGLKAFGGKDGKVRLFRLKKMQRGFRDQQNTLALRRLRPRCLWRCARGL